MDPFNLTGENPVIGLGQKEARDRATARWMIALILVVGAATYSNSLTGAFVFDDAGSLSNNSSIRSLWTALVPPKGAETVSGRPVLNLSFALNYRIHGLSIAGYHVVNVLIHLCGGLTLFGVVRRTLSLELMSQRLGEAATWLAGAAALLWVVHPLQTESVTYIVQRAESLSGLFYLLVIYSFIRGATRPARARSWWCGALLAGVLGAGTKETLVTAPVVVLLFDRTFVSGSFAGAVRNRWKFHAMLAATLWLTVGALMQVNPHRGGTAGVGLAIGVADYLRTQVGAIAMYLKLSLWPRPLVLDYGVTVVRNWSEVAGAGLLLMLLLAATVWALWKAPKMGFLMTAFFACLAPTSSIIPVTTQTIAEHRMYLALAAEITFAVVALWMGWKRLNDGALTRTISERQKGWGHSPAAATACLLAVLFASLTFARNADYRTPLSIWMDTISKRPDNARAYNGAGQALKEMGRFDEAVVFYTRSIELEPKTAKWRNNRGNTYYVMQDYPRAIADYDAALKLDPDLKGAYANRSVSRYFLRQYDLAWQDVRRAVELGAKPHPDFIKALTRASGRAMEPIAGAAMDAE